MNHLLLVADVPWVAEDVRAALGGAAYRLTVTADPRTAADLCREESPDVVLIDLQVGSMGGMAITRAIRAVYHSAGTAPPPTVILLDRDVDAFLAGRAGADAWIRKPLGAFELRHLVDRLAASRAAAGTRP